MSSYLSLILLISLAAANATDKVTTTTTTKPAQREQRQLALPVYLDNTQLEVQQPTPQLQPIAVVSSNQQSPGFLPGLNQISNLPIVGTLLTNLPLQSLTNLLGVTGQNAGLLNLGSLGNLVPLGGVGGQRPPANNWQQAGSTCPLGQKQTCRCEPLLPLPVREALSTELLKIVKQNIRHNDDGSSELRLVISNGLVMYHRNEQGAVKQSGFYALPFQRGHFLNIHYNLDQSNYTVKADIGSSVPKTQFDSIAEP
ncbi:uncharacterized protein LOC108605114 [Drosophila busckii]|uniref:uncharacterized protein LOC108605114 n=1 Tax=Drosophila busckii TaxID=30019 RepID=UPI00083F03B9|nr:uncharacterized protein LOC108605114 [Drosophila busckii]